MSKWGIAPLLGILAYWYLVSLAFNNLAQSAAIFSGIANLIVLVVLILVGLPISALLGVIAFAIFDN